jgi:hypothetical protein
MNLTEELILKYESYRQQGNAVFAVTLSTYVKSRAFANEQMPSFWHQHFIYRVVRALPLWAKRKLDHDYIVECSPDGNYHLHGLFAVPQEATCRIWSGGVLGKGLHRALASFRHAGKYRPFRVNEFLVEPATNIAAWATYITKTLRGGAYEHV